ncbi:MAG: hypothetical protein A2667_02125 [Candidatus Wildermuthbacteria bacterium RIFCSPHIGHO2_01_FULL_47_27]|uniref:Uncharacterized protein n=2 Tax=Candidatus Wildermuthiibacteriota TaxID=1817923 RepID=A0A1G2RTL2_9BACT|nr:MAG: hypothetical protein UY15_C0007G0006 [Parcubacteria group bacterium GW2011_GWA2_47_9]OHA64316.1 MAG: hypothetical protein A2667_02125 [Candidatus Wildermuthbacteria bacterium RIFCSPHIGHO2_01_FULL_47_27]OHA68968.1 MAG: hypothetical protein A3D59_00820 [Candidatus Wildermuthbacteria bacterium RIFCSPHIGHO2_02_FULL_47_17]OHA75411.1 MAG: hypothetical protein A3A32_00710 [Candidatus Wildermuthbacteria bacterium RIFCSPLOWO2_01_FULL_48_35]OHA75949.1 MAG: hypothetical protein A3I38_04095 [Candid
MKNYIPKGLTGKGLLRFLAAVPEVLAKNAFLINIFLIILTLIVGGILYMRIDFIIRASPPELDSPVRFKEEAYQRILQTLNEREEEFQTAAGKTYQDIFSPER